MIIEFKEKVKIARRSLSSQLLDSIGTSFPHLFPRSAQTLNEWVAASGGCQWATAALRIDPPMGASRTGLNTITGYFRSGRRGERDIVYKKSLGIEYLGIGSSGEINNRIRVQRDFYPVAGEALWRIEQNSPEATTRLFSVSGREYSQDARLNLV